MNEPLLVKNGRIIDPTAGIDAIGSIVIDTEGNIDRIETGYHGSDTENYRVIDAKGMVLCPGFIDLHCHLRQPGYEAKETIATGTLAAAKGGFTTVCCMPNTSPPLDSPEMIERIKDIARCGGSVRVLPIGCVTEGRQGKRLAPLAEMAAAGVAGFSDDGSPVYDAELMEQALRLGYKLDVPVIEHCEVLELAAGGVINEGRVSRQLGLKGIPAAAEEEMVARDIRLATKTGGWVHIAHASTCGSVELIRRAKAEGIHVTAEVTPHHLTLTEDEVIQHGSLAKVNPPLRTKEDIDALIDGLKDGTIDIIATDHAPHAPGDKPDDMEKAAFGISIFETALASLMGLVHQGRIGLPELLDKMTRKPAEILGLRPDIPGTLKKGTPADIVIFDPEKEWTVRPEQFVSKGKNTPLGGTMVKGRVVMTVAAGKIVYKEPF